MSVARALGLALLLSGCSGEPIDGGYCARDEDCADGAHCVTGTGVCVRFRNPLDAGMPDLAEPDLASVD